MNKNLQLSSFKNILIGAVLISSSALAQEKKKPDTLQTNALDEVVVTSLRTETKRRDVPQSMTVISKAAIALTPSGEVTDLLKKNSSLNIIQYPGLSAGIGIRGFRPQISGLNQRSLLLVDGRPAGTVSIATINPADIERIEVLKGPASALYGSSAMGGVVNIITKRSSGDVHGNVFAEYGSYETSKLGADAGGNITKKLDFNLSFLTYDRNSNMKLGKGNLFRDLLNADQATYNYTTGPVKVDDDRSDGLRREYTRLNYNTGSLRLGYQISNRWRLDVRGERFVAKNIEAPSDIFYGNAQPSTKDIKRHNEEATLSGNFPNHKLSLKGYTSEENNVNYTLTSGGVKIAPYTSFKSSASWKGIQAKDAWTIGRQSLIFGLDYSSAATSSQSFLPTGVEKAPFSPNYSLNSAAAYVQGQLNFLDNKLVVNPGIRLDLITYDVKQTPLLTTYAGGKQTNPFVSPSLAAQYTAMKLLTVHASTGRAFVTPDAYNVAGYSEILSGGKATVTQGNPNLKNENSISWDAGLRFSKAELGLSADFTYYSTSVKDRITTQRTIPPASQLTPDGLQINSITTYVNANKANINGFEAEFALDFGTLAVKDYSLKLFANTTRSAKAKEITIAADGTETAKDIYNVADFTASYGLEYNNLKGIDLRLSGRYVGKRKDTDFNDPLSPEVVYPEFMTVDFGASYTYQKKHTLSFLINNITDENYYEKRGYNLAGRNFSLRYTLNF
ncbi:TonB-dependent receptor [Pedobacter hartonius]|uniref:Vitamin B12 transporter n=1 Tax=Pedobacter hartonius TaxID=425514 RepID=A0A1H4ARJ4_9SPHI|nr:TonB-dependent receptor [Pedobacter hartonius]SEA38471.1 vitamin B12 transporter [Pedobacter hartonius]